MAKFINEFPQTLTPTEDDALLAKESSRRLATYLSKKSGKPLAVRIEPDAALGESIVIPASAFRLLNNILIEMSKGNSVTLIPIHAELTTQQAADILNVSRPFLVEQLEKGLIPFHKTGTHRRVLFKDVMEYKRMVEENRRNALEELSAIDQELGLGY